MYGGPGDDVYYVDFTMQPNFTYIMDTVVENANEGNDSMIFSATSSGAFTIPDNIENVTSFLPGAYGGITGNSLNNVITSTNGVDNLSGMAGDDTLYGGGGSDVLDGGRK